MIHQTEDISDFWKENRTFNAAEKFKKIIFIAHFGGTKKDKNKILKRVDLFLKD